MSTRTSRISVLALSSAINFIIQFLSPILLVRILDIETFGQYKEFYLYVGLFSSFLNFAIKDNLLYFIPQNPGSEKSLIANTIVIKLIVVVIGLTVISIFKDNFISITSFDFFIPLLVYLFITQNIDFIEIYWLAKKKSGYVLTYSVISIAIRLIIIVTVAYITRNVMSIIYSIIVVEATRTIFALVYLKYNNLIGFSLNFNLLKSQLKYVVPLGLVGILIIFNRDISKVIISANLGASALAFYSVASHRIPFINIIRASISNVIFPDMAEQIKDNKNNALQLWRKSTVLYLFLIAPLAVLMFYYAEVIITTLFTRDYIDAVPIFRIYTIFFLQQAFEMGIPIRAMNKNFNLLFGHITSAILNVSLLYLLFNLLGFIGPAIAFVSTEILITILFGYIILKIYKINVSKLYEWGKILYIIIAISITLPVLFIDNFINANEILKAVLFSSAYLILYLYTLKRFKISEVDRFMNKILLKVKMKW
jgi:O-antigen/teichoic acid export membrane protein